MDGHRQEAGQQLEGGHISQLQRARVYQQSLLYQRHHLWRLLRPLHHPARDTSNPPDLLT